MKKDYQKPAVDKVEFCYRDQVVAASGGHGQYTCSTTWNEHADDDCTPSGIHPDQIAG